MSTDRALRRIAMSHVRGISLITVMVILIVVSLLGLGAARLALLSEKTTRYERDRQVAFEAAEAALTDAQFDIAGPNVSSTSRTALFPGYSGAITSFNPTNFKTGCGVDATTRGMCQPNATGKALAYTVDFSNITSSAPSVAVGTYTGRTFQNGGNLQPALPPRYIIEILLDPHATTAFNAPGAIQQWIYRITAMGYGPTSDTQVVLQMVYRKSG